MEPTSVARLGRALVRNPEVPPNISLNSHYRPVDRTLEVVMEVKTESIRKPVLVRQETVLKPETGLALWTGGLSRISAASTWESALEDAIDAPTILIVDGLELNRRLLKGILKATNYRILEASRPSEAFAMLENEKIDLVMADLVMPEMSGIEFCGMLKADRRTQLIPILMTTGVQGVENEVAGLESGA